MKITRRRFILLGSAAVIAGNNLLTPFAAEAQKTSGFSGALPAKNFSDPLSYLTAEDFKKYVGTEFLLITENGKTSAKLSNLTQTKKPAKTARPADKASSGKAVAETFTLSFRAVKSGFSQNTFRVWHSGIGEFDLFLVPDSKGAFLLHAVINRI
ncbi:MAG TPA: hypothetical protein VK892_11670 [Pyrinomonadaceae bacterium]|nr:hypothetical protein [Pyrinomonadaceae bacterium]